MLTERAEKHAVKLEFIQLDKVIKITERWLSEYNDERPHESLNNMTPEEYRQRHYLAKISKNVWN
ncbi:MULTISPECIES: integrase core domain-containing protein [Edwardsiella]|uniref:IS1400 transposase B n=1 Tax=Edwardsiella anguillarum ET080813 TaxID=667120 RepID=A0A076LRC5_9GAMM|nr:IS1400 transposase B [Edwardsiella anguillarum ET080813]